MAQRPGTVARNPLIQAAKEKGVWAIGRSDVAYGCVIDTGVRVAMACGAGS